MINHLHGTIFDRGKDFVVIECAGIGFKVAVTASTLGELPVGDTAVMILTHLQIRDGGGDIFGFSCEEERELFFALTGVAGVGPKSGMSVLSVLGGNGVISAALRGDAKLFSSVPGIGKKLAQRMVSELPDRLKRLTSGTLESDGKFHVASGNSSEPSEAVDALVSLGFSRTDAHDAVVHARKNNPDNTDSEKLIKDGLVHLYANSRSTSR